MNLQRAPDPCPTPTAAAPVEVTANLLAEITADLSSGTDIRALLRRFLVPVIELARARAGAVRLLGEDNSLHLVSEVGLPAQLRCAEHSVCRDCGSCGQAVNHDQPTWSMALIECSSHTRHLLTSSGFNHLLAVPLGHKGRVLGVYNLFFDQADGASPQVHEMLRSIGDLLGLALDNARLEAENLRGAVMQERQMMAAEVHDAVAQDLTFLRLRLPLLEQSIANNDKVRAMRFLDELRDALGHAHGSLREIITEFRTSLDPQGLVHGLRAKISEFTRRSGVDAHLDIQLANLQLAPAQEIQVLHIVGEALTNVDRHAQAQQAWVRLIHRQPHWVEVCIDDDGTGPGPDLGQPGHHGVSIMSERARRLGGRLDLSTRPGGGTRVTLQFPSAPTHHASREAA